MAGNWDDRRLWHPIGYALTAAWMLIVVTVTDADPRHPFFSFIFIVPLGGWILGLAVARLVTRRRSRDGP